ncbi:MAG: amidohydrolase family protein [Acidimicrobiia bacterium]|nr:amidohydrolase family protein [Acidimicrobiia bacterium]
MIIDCHNHVLAGGLLPGHGLFRSEMTLHHREGSALDSDGEAVGTDEDTLGGPTDPDKLIADHRAVGIALSTVLAVAPSDYTKYGQRGTVDTGRVTGVDGPLSIDLANDYMAALVRRYPDDLVGMAAVNPRYKGVEAAREELRRAIEDLGLRGLKLYPMYDHYSPDDPELALPVFERAVELDIPVMVHMGSTPVRDAPLRMGWPVLLDEVARTFPDLRLLVCHTGFPWVDECLVMVGRHENLYLDVSHFNSLLDQRATYDFLVRAKQLGCSLSKVCFGTDYPGFDPPGPLLARFALVNDVSSGQKTVPRNLMAGMLGGNWARFAGIDWNEDETLDEIDDWEPRWRQIMDPQ